MSTEKPTVKAVVAYAEKLRLDAEQVMNPASSRYDPYAKPYYPTTAGARKLSERMGPEGALEYLRTKAAQIDHAAKEAERDAQRALERHRRRKANAERDRASQRLGVTPGQRIDKVLARFAAVSMVPAAQVGKGVSGGERDLRPQWVEDQAGDARKRALRLANELEELLDAAQSRNLGKAA